MKNFKKYTAIFVIAMALFSCNENKKASPEEMAKNKQFGISENSNPKGLQIGDVAPEIKFNYEGDQLTLKDFYQEKPLVVIFYRGYWCPACNQHLATFEENFHVLHESELNLIAITPESQENTSKTREISKASFPIISDEKGKLMEAFDVAFEVTEDYQDLIEKHNQATLFEINADKEARLPIPATYVIDRDGKIIYRHVNPDYKERASIEDILNSIK